MQIMFANNFERHYEKKNTSDAWWTSHLSQQSSEPAYYIIDCLFQVRPTQNSIMLKNSWKFFAAGSPILKSSSPKLSKQTLMLLH